MLLKYLKIGSLIRNKKGAMVKRKANLNEINNSKFDVIVIGGGATGLGCAVEAVTRGYKTLLLEAVDYAKATSSRSTKLFHGGVRYLAQGDIPLVRSALKERYTNIQNAPHIAKETSFIIPCYNYLGIPFYYTGLKLYDLLAGSLNLSPSKYLSKYEIINKIPNINANNLKGGIQYSDGEFDDTRMAVSLLRTFLSFGGVASNYLKVTNFIKENNKIAGVEMLDTLSNEKLEAKGSCFINATGIFSDNLRIIDKSNSNKVIKFAQGIHIVINKENFEGRASLLVPKTKDGRVLFCVPWHNKVLCGTTDTSVKKAEYEPRALLKEINFVLNTTNDYLDKKVDLSNVQSIYTGIRPLVIDGHSSTSKIARDDKKFISDSGLITIAGGKWTTYRKMGETTLDFAIQHSLLKSTKSRTNSLKLHGYLSKKDVHKIPESYRVYGSDYNELSVMKGFNIQLSDKLDINEAQVEFAVHFEQAETIEDILARRTRCLLLDAKEAVNIAPKVAKIMAHILKKDQDWQNEQISNFNATAQNYIIENYIKH